MMQNLAIISELIRQGNKGIFDLYSKIPYKLRKHLDVVICNEPWDRVNEGCEQRDPLSLENAEKMYQFVLAKADEWIELHKQNRQSDIAIDLTIDKFSIENEFKSDAARFVSEMAKCLKKEKELIFTYQESGNTDSEILNDIEDISSQMDDMDLKAIEELIQQADNHIYQAVKRIDDGNKCFGLSGILDHLTSGDSVETEEGISHFEQYRNFAAEAKSVDMSGEKRKQEVFNFKQKAIEALNEACHRSLLYVEKLKQDLEAWKDAEKCWSVEVGPEPDTGSLINKYKRFGDIIYTVLSWFSNEGNLQVIRQREENQRVDQMDFFSVTVGNLEMQFKEIMSIIQIIVVTQPKGVISIENKGKKDKPNYCTKKTQSFSTTIRILASECFPNFYVKSMEVELVAEKDLAKNPSMAGTSRNNQSFLNVETNTGNARPDIQFNIEVKNFSRFEQNNVYKQFFRLKYKVTVSINDIDINLETMSLPFTFNTGANQILEHKGSRFWYLMSSKNLYSGDFHCPDPLPASDVICMLDNRIACLGQKARRLTEAEKIFLRERLPVASDGSVTMQGFLKDKMRSLRNDEPLSFSFYTWFYAVIHSIELLLLDAWRDGIIYGFCSDKNAADMLMVKDVPEGTFLLRPSVSNINKTSSIEATAALVMEVKMRNENAQPFDSENPEFVIQSLPLYYEHIEENTLYEAINGIEFNNKPVAKFLYGRDGGRRLDILKNYVKKPELKYLPEYFLLIEKVKKLKFKNCSNPATGAAEISDKEEENEQEPVKRKRKYRKSSSNTHSQVPSVVGDDSSRGSSSWQQLTEFPTEEIKQENTSNVQYQPSSAVQSSRSGTQSKKMPGTFDQNTARGNNGQRENSMTPPESMHAFGNIIVDVSHIGKDGTIAGDSFAYNQVANTPPSSSNRGTPQLLNAQFTNGEPNNLGESSMSPPSSVRYNVSVSSPASSVGSSWQSPRSIEYNNSYSPQSGRESAIQLNDQTAQNLPTILNEASESRRNTRRRGNGRGSNNRSSRRTNSSISASPEDEPQIWTQNMNHNVQSQMQFNENDFQQNQNLTLDNNSQISIDFISNSFNLPIEDTLNSYNFMEINPDDLDVQQLLVCVRGQPLCN